MAKFTDGAANAIAESFLKESSIYERCKSTLKKYKNNIDDYVVYGYSIWVNPDRLFCVYSEGVELNECELKEKFDKEYEGLRNVPVRN